MGRVRRSMNGLTLKSSPNRIANTFIVSAIQLKSIKSRNYFKLILSFTYFSKLNNIKVDALVYETAYFK